MQAIWQYARHINFANHCWREKLTYCDLDPGYSRNPMMCRWNSHITSDCDQQILTPSHPLSPSPPTLRGSSHFSYLVSYHRSVCRPAHGHTGVFHNNFLLYKLLALIYLINPFLLFLLALLSSHILRNTSLPKNVPLFCRRITWEILFPLFSLLHLLFDEPKPIIYFEGIKPPCNSTETQSLVLQGKGRWMTISNNGLRLSRRTLPTYKLSNCSISAFVRSRCGSKEKSYWEDPNNYYFFMMTSLGA